MSYEPMLLIRAKDLRTIDFVLDDLKYNQVEGYTEEETEAGLFLHSVLNNESVKFEDSEFFICHPEFSSFNANVREFLDDFDVYYRTWV